MMTCINKIVPIDFQIFLGIWINGSVGMSLSANKNFSLTYLKSKYVPVCDIFIGNNIIKISLIHQFN